MRAGDTVLHRPSGERWLVAWVRGDRMGWCGWPDGACYVAELDVVHACSDEKHEETLRRIADADGDYRSCAAWENLLALLESRGELTRVVPVTTTRFVRAGGAS